MLRGELTNLRAVERSDSGTLHRWFNDPDLMYYWGLSAAVVSSTEVQRRIEHWLDEEGRLGRPAGLVIEDLDGAPVGLAILSRYETVHGSCELSLLIGERERWGEGLGTDALSTVVDACFGQWRMYRLWLRVEAFNERALRFYERCGFKRDAVMREASFHDGAYHDLHVYSLLATDPRPGGDVT